MAGQGWRMLMECLAAGRAISLPSSRHRRRQGDAALVDAPTGASASSSACRWRAWRASRSRSRGMIESAYACEAARAVTAAMVSRGERPSVISALMKYQTTERMRRAVNDAMDIHGGRAICDGPGNYLQSAYQMVPVGITVEGANILTRTLITFAQGALRSHPYLYQGDPGGAEPRHRARPRRLRGRLPRPHRLLGIERLRRLLPQRDRRAVRAGAGEIRRHGALVSPALARVAQLRASSPILTVASLGGGLKMKQKLTGRLADALSELYMLACVVEALRGRRAACRATAPIVDLAAHERALSLPGSAARRRRQLPRSRRRAGLMRIVVFPLGKRLSTGVRPSRPPRRASWCSSPAKCAIA